MHSPVRNPSPPLTRSVEDYLKAIYHLSSQGGFATTSDIAAMLEVAPPSVSGMMKRLSETGLIEHVPYLSDPALANRPVAAVAARWGFTSAADFSRAFRAEHGMPPSE